VHTADARPFLRRTDERYDLIFVDAYRPPYVPFYLATREFFALARDRLKPGGMIALNVATVPEDHRLAEGIARTLRSEFPQVVTWQPLRFNQIVIGLDRVTPLPVLRARARRTSGEIRSLGLLLARGLRESRLRGNAWTDDRAPVEWITDRMIVEFAAGGGSFEEFPLPTGP
jgi:hypothetical protein